MGQPSVCVLCATLLPTFHRQQWWFSTALPVGKKKAPNGMSGIFSFLSLTLPHLPEVELTLYICEESSNKLRTQAHIKENKCPRAVCPPTGQRASVMRGKHRLRRGGCGHVAVPGHRTVRGAPPGPLCNAGRSPFPSIVQPSAWRCRNSEEILL